MKRDKITTEATNLLILLRDTIGHTDELDHLTTKCTNTVKGMYSRDLAIKLKKLQTHTNLLTTATNTDGICNSLQTVIDYSEKITIKEKEVLAKGGSFALKPVLKTIDITTTIEKACIQLRMLNNKKKSTSTAKKNTNDDPQFVNNPFTNPPFEIPRIIAK